MALNIESKLMEYNNTQQTITSLLEESAMLNVIEAMQESATQTQKCVGFKQSMLDEAEKQKTS